MTPGTVASQAPLSLGIILARILEWAAIPSPGDFPDPGLKLAFRALAGRFFITEPSGEP